MAALAHCRVRQEQKKKRLTDVFALKGYERKDLLLLVAASAKNLSGISFSRQYASQLQHGGVPM